MALETAPRGPSAESQDRNATTSSTLESLLLKYDAGNGLEISKQVNDFLLHEYDALRSEILKQIEIGHQLTTFALTPLGVFLGLKFANNVTWPLLSYPAIALGLSLWWQHTDARSQEIGKFIKEHIEPYYLSVVGLERGWEYHLAASPIGSRLSRGGVIAIFLLTELFAILVATLVPPTSFPLSTEGIIITVAVAVLSFIVTFFVLLWQYCPLLLHFLYYCGSILRSFLRRW